MDETMKPVLVTTAYKGLFFGYLPVSADETARTLVLYQCRNAIYYSGTSGFLGLAAHGPQAGSRIGATAPRIVLHEVTSVADCTPDATEAWANW